MLPICVGAVIDCKARHFRRGQCMQALVTWLAENGSDGVINDMRCAVTRLQPHGERGAVDDRAARRLIVRDAWLRRAMLLRDCVIKPAAQNRQRACIQSHRI